MKTTIIIIIHLIAITLPIDRDHIGHIELL